MNGTLFFTNYFFFHFFLIRKFFYFLSFFSIELFKYGLSKKLLFEFFLPNSFFVLKFNFNFLFFFVGNIFPFFIFIIKELVFLDIFTVYFSINFFSYFFNKKSFENKVFPFFSKLFYFIDFFSFFFFNLFLFHVFAIIFNYFLSVNLDLFFDIKFFLTISLNFKKYLYIYSRRPFMEKSLNSIITCFLLDLLSNKFIFLDDFYPKFLYFDYLNLQVDFLYPFFNKFSLFFCNVFFADDFLITWCFMLLTFYFKNPKLFVFKRVCFLTIFEFFLKWTFPLVRQFSLFVFSYFFRKFVSFSFLGMSFKNFYFYLFYMFRFKYFDFLLYLSKEFFFFFTKDFNKFILAKFFVNFFLYLHLSGNDAICFTFFYVQYFVEKFFKKFFFFFPLTILFNFYFYVFWKVLTVDMFKDFFLLSFLLSSLRNLFFLYNNLITFHVSLFFRVFPLVYSYFLGNKKLFYLYFFEKDKLFNYLSNDCFFLLYLFIFLKKNRNNYIFFLYKLKFNEMFLIFRRNSIMDMYENKFHILK